MLQTGGAVKLELRPYQRQSIDAIRGGWARGLHNVLVTSATGTGKTEIFLALIDEVLKEHPDWRVMILCHMDELVRQPIRRLALRFPELTKKSGIVMGAMDDAGCQIIGGSVQTLVNEKRLARVLAHGPINLLITDECFPAGTLVDGRPIETLRVGDEVTGGTVTEIMRRRAPASCCVLWPAADSSRRQTHSGRRNG
jgi:superfamily II DNA or RNA helicase